MKGLYFDGTMRYVEDLPLPAMQEGESLVRIELAAICNTDKEILRGYKPDFKGIMGHEFVGIVEQSDNPDLVGKRVVGELNAGCGQCLYCQTGRENHCDHRKVIGIHNKDGCFAEYMTISTHLLHPVPESLSPQLAIFTEPLAAALELLEQAHIKPSQNVAVLGDGRLAYMIAQVVALQGVDLTVIGRHPEKLETFSGFAKTTTQPNGSYEVVIDATGSPTGFASALSLVRKRGTILLKSTYAGTTQADLSTVVVNEITVKGSRCGPFPPALQLLRRGLICLPSIDLYPLNAYEKAFASKAFKAGFCF